MTQHLLLYNTLTRQKDPFHPLTADRVGMYVCGPTVYDFAHIGNARPVVVFDVLARLLRRHFAEVCYVRNITDVDDKINAAARANNEPIRALTERTAAQFHADMAALNALPPDIEPRATEHIAEMLIMIKRLIASGHAYAAEGHVLFSVPAMADYGQLSRRQREDMIAGARVEVAPYKRDPADFVLWKPSDADTPGWDSPWGRGRPGWHIECSAMSGRYLGETFDIHGGGQDLIFPHHENEIAQSQCAHAGAPFVRYWMHNGYVMVEGEKMSKSLGNFFTVRQLLDQAPGEAIRLVLLQTHYRQPLDFTRAALTQAKSAMDRLYTALRLSADVAAAPPDQVRDLVAPVEAALLDDLGTAQALAAVHELASALNKATQPSERARLKGALLEAGHRLGLLQQDPEAWFRWAPQSDSTLDEAEIERLITARNTARKSRDFARADAVRDQLSAAGIVLEDGPNGTTWKRG